MHTKDVGKQKENITPVNKIMEYGSSGILP
jgi:hypothetical protein